MSNLLASETSEGQGFESPTLPKRPVQFLASKQVPPLAFELLCMLATELGTVPFGNINYKRISRLAGAFTEKALQRSPTNSGQVISSASLLSLILPLFSSLLPLALVLLGLSSGQGFM